MFRAKMTFLATATLAAATMPMTALGEGSWDFASAPVGEVLVDNGQAKCGGTLVGADIVMTAAHCVVPSEEYQAVAPGDIRFSLKSSSGAAQVFTVKDIAIPFGFFHPGSPDLDAISKDVALLKLTEFVQENSDSVSAPDTSSSYVALLPASTDDPFSGEPCQVDYQPDNIMVLECSREKGASGSPVYALIEGERRLVGVISSNGQKNGRDVVFAATPISVIEDLRWQSEDAND